MPKLMPRFSRPVTGSVAFRLGHQVGGGRQNIKADALERLSTLARQTGATRYATERGTT